MEALAARSTAEPGRAASGHAVAAPELPAQLSSAERAVVAAALRGCSHAETARERGSSPRTVANLLARAFRKLEVRSRAELAAKLVMRGGELPREAAKLSDRERQAATLAALGHSNKHIAYELGVTSSTVSTFLERAVLKLGARSRVGLIQMMSAIPVETLP
jgi:DNA-binding NarL/FixJ family response regulator